MGKLTSLLPTTVNDMSAVITFAGAFAGIDVSTSGFFQHYDATATSTGTDLNGLTPGATYYVTTTLYNTQGASIAGNTTTFTTMSKIRTLTTTAIDSSSIMVYWTASGAISYVSLVWNTTGGTYNVGDSSGIFYGSPIDVSGLGAANTRYYFQITPVSTAGTGYAVQDASAVTYPTMTYLTYTTYDTSAVVSFGGAFSYVDISLSTGFYKKYSVGSANTGTDISWITPGTTYTITTIIYNSAGATSIGNTITLSTWPKIATATATVYDCSAIDVTWTYSGVTPSTVSVVWNTIGTTYLTTDSSASYSSSITTTRITGLTSNAVYYFQVTPTATSGTGYAYKDISAATAPMLTSYSATMYDVSGVLSFDGSYSYVDVSYSTIRNRYYSPTKTTGTDVSNLSSNYYYTFTLTAYNAYGTSTKYSVSAYTAPKLSSFAATAIDGSAISVVAIGTFTSVTVQYNIVGGTFYSTDASTSLTTSNTAVVVSGLYPYKKYYFRATPVGAAGATGTYFDNSMTTFLDFSGTIQIVVIYT
jgi:hypothetical protein